MSPYILLGIVLLFGGQEPKKQDGLKFHTAPRSLAQGAVFHDWKEFLGPTQNALSSEKPLRKKFGQKPPPLVWEVKKGEGYASPSVVKGRVLLFHRVGDEEVLECLHAENGQRYWKYAYRTEYQDRYGFSGGPRCQPVSDGEFVYTLGAEGKLHCLKLETGASVWKQDIVKEYQLPQNFFGVGATPLIEGDLLIVNVGAQSGPCVVAYNRRNGQTVWKAGKEWGPSYASPISAVVNGKRRIFVFAGGESRPSTGGLLCIDPANGKIDFQFAWRARRYESVNASSPLVIGNRVYISECYGMGGTLLEVQPDGSHKQVWESKALGTHFMTAIHKDGYLYGIDGHGPRNAPLVCIDLKTGKEVWRNEPEWEESLKTPDGNRKVNLFPGLASLIMVDGQCLMLSNYGHLVWLDLNPKGYKELERISLFVADETWTMPALSRGLLYVCQNTKSLNGTPPRLLCYDMRGE